MHTIAGDTRIEIVKGDLTKEKVDAVVNAANNSLLGGGGVDGAIHKAGGPVILEACKKLGGCETGEAKITVGGDLPARYVIHTVGPIYHDGNYGEALFLASCYRRSLELALEYNISSLAFPAISCGVYGYPIPEATHIALSTVKSFCETNKGINLVRFVLFSKDIYATYESELSALDVP